MVHHRATEPTETEAVGTRPSPRPALGTCSTRRTESLPLHGFLSSSVISVCRGGETPVHAPPPPPPPRPFPAEGIPPLAHRAAPPGAGADRRRLAHHPAPPLLPGQPLELRPPRVVGAEEGLPAAQPTPS